MIGIDTSFLVAFELRGHPGHERARLLAREITGRGDRLGLAPQVLTEFAHVASDHRRFTRPLTMPEALERASAWTKSVEVDHVFPGSDAVDLFLRWMGEFSLGRKQLLDTMLAATYVASGIGAILTTDARDFARYPGLHPLLVS